MIPAGVAFILWATLVKVFSIDLTLAAFVTGIVFILLGLLIGERWPRKI